MIGHLRRSGPILTTLNCIYFTDYKLSQDGTEVDAALQKDKEV